MTAELARTLVIDENLPKRLATELSHRGRHSQSVSQLGLRGSSDPELLTHLDGQLDRGVLVTADDRMPLSHADAINAVAATLAIVHPAREAGWAVDPWRREVVHRWAHAV